MPGEHRAYGIIGCGAATGDIDLVQEFPLKEQAGLCEDMAMKSAGMAASNTAVFAVVSAQGMAKVTHYFIPSRVDFLLQAHLPLFPQGHADAVGRALR